MSLITRVLARLGFVRLKDHGLVLTDDGRVVHHPALAPLPSSQPLSESLTRFRVEAMPPTMTDFNATYAGPPPLPMPVAPVHFSFDEGPPTMPPTGKPGDDEWEQALARAKAMAAAVAPLPTMPRLDPALPRTPAPKPAPKMRSHTDPTGFMDEPTIPDTTIESAIPPMGSRRLSLDSAVVTGDSTIVDPTNPCQPRRRSNYAAIADGAPLPRLSVRLRNRKKSA